MLATGVPISLVKYAHFCTGQKLVALEAAKIARPKVFNIHRPTDGAAAVLLNANPWGRIGIAWLASPQWHTTMRAWWVVIQL